jgi:hypothetical protein
MSLGSVKFSGPNARLSIGKMRTDWGKNELFGEKPVPVPLVRYKSHEDCHEREPGPPLPAQVESDLPLFLCLSALLARGFH